LRRLVGRAYATLSTQSITSPSPATPAAGACAACGAPLAADQRYCLECGTRQLAARSRFLDSFTPSSIALDPPARRPASSRPSGASAIAGVGVLLLAMGVGVLIGRAGAGKTPAATPPQVISVAAPAAIAPATGSTTEPPGSTATHGGAGSSSGKSSSGGKSSGAASSGPHSSGGSKGSGKAPAATAPSSSPKSGQSFEQKSRNLPNVVSTG
jgi:hypothetical protein